MSGVAFFRSNSVRLLVLLVEIVIFVSIAVRIESHQIWGMDVIQSIQAFRNHTLDTIMFFCSICGFELLFLMVPLLLWWGNRSYQELGLNIFYMLNYSILINSMLKITFQESRPIWVNKSIHRQDHIEMEYSFPSGHSVATATMWLMIMQFLSHRYKSNIVYIPGCIVIGLTCFSRVYFGVHYPHDVVAGVFLSSILFSMRHYLTMFPESSPVQKQSTRKEYHHIVILAVMFLLAMIVFQTIEGANKRQQLGIFFTLGQLFIGAILRPYVTILEDTIVHRRLLRLVLGLLPVFVLGLFFRSVQKNLQTDVNAPVELFMFVIGIILGIWQFTSHGLFQRIGLGAITLCTKIEEKVAPLVESLEQDGLRLRHSFAKGVQQSSHVVLSN